MNLRKPLRRTVAFLLLLTTGSLIMTSCASSSPRYGCPGGINQGSRYNGR